MEGARGQPGLGRGEGKGEWNERKTTKNRGERKPVMLVRVVSKKEN